MCTDKHRYYYFLIMQALGHLYNVRSYTTNQTSSPTIDEALEGFKITLETCLEEGFWINYTPADTGESLLSSVILYFSRDLRRYGYGNNSFVEEILLRLVKELLAHGANVNCQNSQGWTPLMFIAAIGQPYSVEIMQILLNAGANVSITNQEGRNAFDILAAEYIFNASHGEDSTKLQKVTMLLNYNAILSEDMQKVFFNALPAGQENKEGKEEYGRL